MDYIDPRAKIPDYILASVSSSPNLGAVSDNKTSGNNGKLLDAILNIAWGGERVADALMTRHAIDKHGAKELNPLAAPFVNAGVPGMIALNTGLTAGSYGLSRLLSNNVSPLAGKLFPLLGALTHAIVFGS